MKIDWEKFYYAFTGCILSLWFFLLVALGVLVLTLLILKEAGVIQ